MAIVADHLGLSWTELAREMNFTVDEINHIRLENPNSLTAQSFMLLKKWVSREGKNATTDALTEVLTKVNRMDIVTLLEGPIFDYGNISGTRCFADDNAVFRDQADGWHSDSSSVNVEPPTPGRSVSSDLLDKQESQENSSESITSSSRAESGRSRPNGNNSKHSPQDASSDSSTGRKDGTLLSEKKIQQGDGARKCRRSGDKKHHS
ncbi:Ankyrin-3 [Ilyodon furcidens]|uniref:Ankyrin-3 n=1 Tax=Ilyodon furcidens TaxID=33524 RepID=A0ABV0UD41_9TELE